MRCKGCQYPLWNLKGRVCPECGSPFVPSDFEFASSSVRFMCPHCAQPYYGTDERGHLVPVEFGCVRCGQHIHMDQMVLLPTEGVAEDQTTLERSPWLEPRGKRLFPWARTILWALFQPRRLVRATPPEASLWSAVFFALVTNAVYLAIGLAPLVLLIAFSAPRGSAAGVLGAISVGGLIVLASLAFIVLVWTVVSHGLLRATGATDSTIGRTAQAICYASAANVLVGVPCLGFYASVIGVLWWIVGATVMVMEAQKVTPVRAMATVAAPALAAVGVTVTITVLWLAGLMSAAGAFTATSTATTAPFPPPQTAFSSPANDALSRPAETRLVLDALLAHAKEHAGQGPDHAARLVVDGRLTPVRFLAGGSGTSVADVMVGEVPLSLLRDAQNAEQALSLAAAELSALAPAYRVGDYVFTHAGIDLAGGDADLWVVVCAPDQAAPWAVRIAGVTVPVGRLGGTVTPIASEAFPAVLAEQNQLRARYGLAPLPDPALIRNATPASGER